MGAELARRQSKALGFDAGRLDQPVGTLSGGNQQKIVIGKWLHRAPKVLLLDEPTRGIDVGAKAEIFRSIRALAEQGLAVILVSSELEEVTDNADRIMVLARGRIQANMPAAEASVDRLLSIIFAARQAA